MVSFIKLFSSLAVVLSLCSQLTQAFCVYNNLEGEGSSIYAFNVIHDEERSFKKTIAQGGKECCPYDNADCNPGLDRRSPIDLNVVFTFKQNPASSERRYTIYCEGGAGITITGSSLDNIAFVCNRADGFSWNASLLYYIRA